MFQRFRQICQDPRQLEIIFGMMLAVFAGILAVNDLLGGKYGSDELKWVNEKSQAYQWYQSKSIKQSLAEGQRELINTLLIAGVVDKSAVEQLRALGETISGKMQRYEKEKTEILRGSQNIGEENWVQKVDGKLGQILGAQELDQAIGELGSMLDFLDLASLCLQLALVTGAIGIVMGRLSMKLGFMVVSFTAGTAGLICLCLGLVRLTQLPSFLIGV